MAKVFRAEEREYITLPERIYDARLSKVKETPSKFGSGLRLQFTITNKKYEGQSASRVIWINYDESGKPHLSRESEEFMRKIVGAKEIPETGVDPEEYIGETYKVHIKPQVDKKDKTKVYNTVVDILPSEEEDDAPVAQPAKREVVNAAVKAPKQVVEEDDDEPQVKVPSAKKAVNPAAVAPVEEDDDTLPVKQKHLQTVEEADDFE